MNVVKYEHFKAFDAIYDHEFAYWKTAHIRPQIVIPPATCSWIPSERSETVGESLRLAVSELYATAFSGYPLPGPVAKGENASNACPPQPQVWPRHAC